MNVLLIIPPLTQLNTPYPSTTVLKGYLNKQGVSCTQVDLGIELVNKVFSKEGLEEIFNAVSQKKSLSVAHQQFLNLKQEYCGIIDAIMQFLRGNDPSLATRVAEGNFLPQGKRFQQDSDLEWAFGTSGTYDKAKHLATLFIEDITDFIRQTLNPHFDLVRYAEKLSLHLPDFKPLLIALNQPLNLIDEKMLEILEYHVNKQNPDLIGFSIPFPGNLYGALKCCQWLREHKPKIKIILGGGYINTELRQITDTQIFNFVDYICLDDGELPLLNIIRNLEGKSSRDSLIRTFIFENYNIKYCDSKTESLSENEKGTPDFEGLSFDLYLSLCEMTNPMHRLWSDGKWNKMSLAHGCYWAKCAFCDTSLDYIHRFNSNSVVELVNRMEAVMKQTGQSGFHFTDEAAPPVLLKQLALEILNRGMIVSWWTNIRFEKAFTAEACRLLAASGCIAVTGGLETASDRLLLLMNKGVSLEQAAQTAYHFTKAGIMVHAYLMYGFPSQTFQETIDSLEVVRQFYEHGLIQSAYWHRFALTVHSPVYANPDQYSINIPKTPPNSFANNEAQFIDPVNCQHEKLSSGLQKAVYNYMHGLGYEMKVNQWFPFKTPPPRIPASLVARFLKMEKNKA